MKTRDHVLVNAETLTDTKTFTKSLGSGLKVQYLRVLYQATNGATSNTLGKLNGMVSKLEVLDGSSPLHSTSMRQNQALHYYRDGRLPFQQLNSKAAGVVIEEAIINFGRYLGDRDYYLDTTNHPNAQLSFASALTISATAGFATGTGVLTVIARLIEDGAPPCQGFILQKQVDSWTTLASGDQNTTLPTDGDYQGLLIGDLETTIEADVDISNVKLSINNDQFIPFNLSTAQILYDSIARLAPAQQRLNFLNDTAVTWLSDIYARGSAWMGPQGGTAKGGVTSMTGESIVAYMTTGDTASLFINVSGYAPHSQLWVPFGDGRNPDDFLKMQGVNKAQLACTNGGAAGAGTIVVCQVAR